MKNSSILLGSSLDSRCLKNKNKKSCFWKSVKLTRFARLLPLPAYKSSRERCWSLRGAVLLRRDSDQTSCRGTQTTRAAWKNWEQLSRLSGTPQPPELPEGCAGFSGFHVPLPPILEWAFGNASVFWDIPAPESNPNRVHWIPGPDLGVMALWPATLFLCRKSFRLLRNTAYNTGQG